MEGRLYYPLSPVNSVVVGSSRVMQINSSVIGEDIQNFAVSSASIEDDIAFGLEALAKLNYENIYISADPWILNLILCPFPPALALIVPATIAIVNKIHKRFFISKLLIIQLLFNFLIKISFKISKKSSINQV